MTLPIATGQARMAALTAVRADLLPEGHCYTSTRRRARVVV